MKPIENVLKWREGQMRENNRAGDSKNTISTYVNIIIHPPVQLLYANNKNKEFYCLLI
jgi:hypothetical protein